MDLEPAKRVNGRMWQPGQSGNPLGRPIGARGRFSQQFIEDMRASWRKHGATVMDRVSRFAFDVLANRRTALRYCIGRTANGLSVTQKRAPD